MSDRSHRLVRNLSRLFQGLRILCVAALLILMPALAEVFQEGIRLREDSEGTI